MGEPNKQESITPAISATGAARRRFARGLGASGVVMTLASQPGMAAAVCTSPSGSLSSGMQTSHAPTVPPLCGGMSPGFYKNNPGGWPAQFPSTTTKKFGEIFPTTAGASMALAGLTLMQVFELNGDGGPKKPRPNGPVKDIDAHNVGSHILACYFNLLTNRTTVLSDAMIRNIWREYDNTAGGKFGYYKPAAKVEWKGDKIVSYLKTTFHQPK